MNRKRVDQVLVERGLVSSRTLAQDLIKRAQVFVIESGKKILVQKSGYLVAPDSQFEISESELQRFVSRAGLKLEKALEKTKIHVKNYKVLDVGLSTGGFADCLIQNGVHSVVGIEVGHGQIHEKLTQHPKVKVFEGINARNLRQLPEVTAQFPADGFDLIVMDVSFISMTLIIPEVLPYLNPRGYFLALVKPQFEVGADKIGKGGIVKDPKYYVDVENKIQQCLSLNLMKIMDYFPSELEGKDGNQEFFVLACRR